MEVNWNYVCWDVQCVNYVRRICKQYELIPSYRPINIRQRPALSVLMLVIRYRSYSPNNELLHEVWITDAMALNKFCKSCRPSTCRRSRNFLSLSSFAPRTPTNSLLSFSSDNFFFGAILSSTMHIYVLASAKDKRNRLVSGSGTGGVDEVAAAKEGPVFVTGGRKHSHPLITQLKWTGNVPLVHTPHARHALNATTAPPPPPLSPLPSLLQLLLLLLLPS